MSHFLVYIPRDDDFTQITELDLGRVGLSDLIEGAETLGVDIGPDGKQGMLYGWRKPTDREFLYDADRQEWFPCKADGDLEAGRYWVGVWIGREPTPKCLMRNYPKRGMNVTLGDGNAWHFPKIQELPADAVRADDGTWKFVVQRQYAQIHVECERWERVIAENLQFDFGELVEFLIRCLGLNYRLAPDLVEHLKLFSTENILKGLFAVLGFDAEGNRT